MGVMRVVVAGAVLTLTAAWASAETTPQGRFGGALQPREQYVAAAPNPVYSNRPITVECWAKLKSKTADTVLVANEPKSSTNHWQIRAQKDTGHFAVWFAHREPKLVESKVDIVNEQWHHVAMVYDDVNVRLYVDAKQVAEGKVEKRWPYPDVGPLMIGHHTGQPGDPEAVIDEVRITRGERPPEKVPAAPFEPDADTIGLWHFDETGTPKSFADASATRNAAVVRRKIDDPPPMPEGQTRWNDMDLGPLFSSSLQPSYPPGNVVHKAVTVKLGEDGKTHVAFDTETLRPAIAWTGGGLSFSPGREGLSGPPAIVGEPIFGTSHGPGWAKPGTEDFTDPRPDKLGPLPEEWGRYKGLYVKGDDVVLSYTVGDTEVLELHGVEWAPLLPPLDTRDNRDAGGAVDDLALQGNTDSDPGPRAGPPGDRLLLTTRTIEIAPHEQALSVRVCEAPDATVELGDMAKGQGARLQVGDEMTIILCPVAPKGARWKVVNENGVGVTLPATKERTVLKVAVARRPAGGPKAAIRFSEPLDLHATKEGGPANWPEAIVTKGELGTGDGAYVVDTLTAPDKNPWNSFLRFGGLDFLSNGDMAICSVSGDVWLVSGIDDKLETLKWKRYATGLFQPLGLKVVDDKVYVLGRDQITRLHDLNGDREADFYENFNNDAKVTLNGHAYVTNLDTDPAGNFYYTKCGDSTEHGGTLLRVSADGSRLDVFATGLRNPNGMGVSPDGIVTQADNQGEWVPASRLDIVSQGEFVGYQPMSKRNPPPTDPGKPLCWMPQNVDNSSGGQTWVTSDQWGPFKGHMLHTSYGAASLLLVLQEQVNGIDQGGVVRFPLSFASGIMRGRFHDKDGQLYVCGLKGWQTAGARDGAVQRVRYTGKPVNMPRGLHIHENGIRIEFTDPMDVELLEDLDSYGILQWNYLWSGAYGSPQLSVKDPSKQGYDTVEIKSATAADDGKSVFLAIDGLGPVMQMQISLNLEDQHANEVRWDIYNTIHALGERFTPAE